MKKSIVLLAAMILSALILSGVSSGADYTDEPPTNTFLADSPWPMIHRNSYCQASSPFPGPEKVRLFTRSTFTAGMPGTVNLSISGKYPDGKRVMWGNSMTDVFKTDLSLNYIAAKGKGNLLSFFDPDDAITDKILSGAYTLVDKDNVYYMPQETKICAFRDAVAGNRYSGIAVKGIFEIPSHMIDLGENEKIVALNMTYDGMLAFATSLGLVGVVSRSLDQGTAHYLDLGTGSEVSNSIACDEEGGIYVVTSEQMHRVQWTGSELTIDPSRGGWSAEYETGGEECETGMRLGGGSGSTPTLMGTADDGDHKFVVITDGQCLMHLVLFWRGNIPSDWQQIPGTKSRRIAAQAPVRFGDPDAEDTLSEQSVLVRGYGAVVVNNQLKAPVSGQILSVLLSGLNLIAPKGLEKFEWNPATRRLETVWVNQKVSIPNAIPSMSQSTGLIYGVGQKLFFGWSFEAIDWYTGDSIFSFRYGATPALNSAYAATQIGMDGCLYSGTLMGMVRMIP